MQDFIFKKILLIESNNNNGKIRKKMNSNFQAALSEFKNKHNIEVTITPEEYNNLFIQLIKESWLVKGCCPNIFNINNQRN